MSEFDDMLGSILSDPGQMKKIMDIAGSLIGSEKETAPPKAPADSLGALAGLSDIPVGEIMGAAQKLLGGSGGGQMNEKRALLNAMQPWMSEKRRNKLDRAMKMASAMRIALAIFKKTGADEK